jgi:hypothetical protein
MRDMVMNPEAHNIKFMGERVPFEGQTLGSSLSVPDVAGEQAAIDDEFSDKTGDTSPVILHQNHLLIFPHLHQTTLKMSKIFVIEQQIFYNNKNYFLKFLTKRAT